MLPYKIKANIYFCKHQIGRQLLQAAHARALEDGKVRMDLTTAHNNTRAQALYESMGWIHDTVFRTYTLRGGAV